MSLSRPKACPRIFFLSGVCLISLTCILPPPVDCADTTVLKRCDAIRDDELPNLGVRLEDKEQGPVVKFVDREELMKERERELALKAEKERKKAEAAAKRAQEEAEKMEKAKLAPEDMFKNDPAYSQFDERGLPTHSADGEPLPKAAVKKLEKLWKVQEKLHTKYFPRS
eukprot:m.46094 g.46094  ORF g.46094 m.46094 type:complete len:169 (-) comp12224_c0_seq1:92-598(-)